MENFEKVLLIFYMSLFISVFYVLFLVFSHWPANDLTSHIPYVYFFEKYGLGYAPEWYNGFYPFDQYQPGSFAFLSMLDIFLKNYLFSYLFANLIFIFISLLLCLLIGKELGWPKLTGFFFFLLFMVMPGQLNNFVWQRFPEMFGWLIFLLILLLFLRYREKKLDLGFYASFIFANCFLIFSYSAQVVFLFFIFLSFLIRRNFEKPLILSYLLSFVLSLPWLIKFLGSFGSISVWPWTTKSANFVLYFLSTRSIDWELAPMFFVLFLISLVSFIFFLRKSKKDLCYVPLAFLSFLNFTFIYAFLPALKYIFEHTFICYYAIIASIFFLGKKEGTRIFLSAFLLISLSEFFLLAPLANLSSDTNSDYYRIIDDVSGKFFILDGNFSVTKYFIVDGPIYAYAAINGKTMPTGPKAETHTLDAQNIILNLGAYIKEVDCEKINKVLFYFKVEEIISAGSLCNSFEKKCGFELKKQLGNVCLLKVL